MSFRTVAPFVVTPATLAVANVPEPAGNVAYSNATTYAAGNQAVEAEISYVSLQNGNLNHDPSTSPTWWWPIGPQPWVSGHAYLAADVASDVHRTYVAKANVTSATHPAADPTNWTDTGPTNTWAPFDNYATTQSSFPTTIDLKVAATGIVNVVALFALQAATARLIISTVADGTVFDETFDLTDPAGIHDPFAYSFNPITRKADLVVVDLPNYANPSIEVILADTSGATVKLGSFLLGQANIIANVQYSPQLGITDYSTKDVDSFGNSTIVQKAFAKRATMNLLVDAQAVDSLEDLLAAYRATPILYAGDESYSSMAVFGFYKSFTTTIGSKDVSICALELEGLI